MPSERNVRVGVLGGTFDPVHLGHLVIAQDAAHARGLDAVVFVPARTPPHKLDVAITPAAHRLAMLMRAAEEDDRFIVSRVDLDRAGPHYTVDMLPLLRDDMGLDPRDDLYFVMGADSLVELPTWRDPLGIARQARLLVLDRPGFEVDWVELERALPGIRARVDTIRVPLIGVSGTALRHRVRQGQPIRYLVPASVEAYIRDHDLYRDDGGEPRRG